MSVLWVTEHTCLFSRSSGLLSTRLFLLGPFLGSPGLLSTRLFLGFPGLPSKHVCSLGLLGY